MPPVAREDTVQNGSTHKGNTMTTTDTSTSSLPAERRGRRKIRAILAAGVVLGVGAAVTLAAWNDSETVTGTFTAGSFNLQGSTTGATTGFADHNVADGDTAASLAFALPANLSQNIAPAQTVYSPFWVRLAAGTTTGADLAVAAAAGTGTNAANLSYAVYSISASATCDAATVASLTPVASGATLNTAPGTGTVGLTKGAGAPSVDGDAVQLCFAVTGQTGLVQGGASVATWTLTATSTS